MLILGNCQEVLNGLLCNYDFAAWRQTSVHAQPVAFIPELDEGLFY